MTEKDISSKLKKILETDDYLQSIKLLAENESDLGGMTPFLSLLIIPSISKMLESLEKEKKYEEAIIKIDEILNIEGTPILIKSFCLNYQGCILLEISKDNRKEAFEKFYAALELFPEDKRIAKNIENFFPFSSNSNEVHIYINKIYKYKDKFSDNFLCFLGLYEACLAYDDKDYDKSYDLAIKNVSKAYEIYSNNKKAINVIIHILIFSASEVYSNYIKNNDTVKAENIYNTVNNLLKDNDSKDKMNILFGIGLFISNEFELAFKKFESISEKHPGKKILKAFYYYEYIKNNIKKENKLDKCIEYINLLKDLKIDNEDLQNDINYLDFLIFIRKSELEFEKNDFSSYNKIEKMLEKEIDIKKRCKLEELKKTLIKKKKEYYFKEKNYNEFLKENKDISNLISEIYQEESTEEIEKNNFNVALNKIEKAIELKPNNAEFINSKAYINTQKGQFDVAINDIDLAIKIEPENNNYQNNKLEIIEKKYDTNLNKILNIKEKEYIENSILNNDNINIQQNSIDLSLKLTKKKIQEISQKKMGDIIINNILLIKDSKKGNENFILNEKNDEVDKIILTSKSSELILENIKNNNINILDKEIKQKIEECLDIKEKDIQNNVLSTYAQIKNLDKKEMEKPLEIVNLNLKYEINNQQINKNVEVIQNFLEQEKSLDIDPETASNLLEIITINDFTKYSEEERENDEILDNEKPLFQYFKDKTKEGIALQLKGTLNEYSYDKNLQNQVKSQIEQYINIDDNILKNSQKLKKETNDKIFNCIQAIAKSERGLSKNNLEKVGNVLGKIQEDSNLSEEYKNYVKDKIVETVNISFIQKKETKLPDNLINNLSKELIKDSSDKKIFDIFDKASDNQKLPQETQNNLINILADKNIENLDDTPVDEQKYELTYQILNKNYNNLSESQQKVVSLEKNTIEINKQNNEEKIINSLDNISSIVNEGYSLNKHAEKTILNLLNNNKENEKYLEKSTKVINNMAVNSMNVSKDMSGFIVKKIDENKKKPTLSKNAFTELLACLVNIVDNCNVPKNSVEAFESCLKDIKKGEKNIELKLAITGLSILSKKHYSLNKEAINSCLDIIESNVLEENSLKELSYIIDKLFNETEIDNKTFTKLLLILIKNPNLLDKLAICLYSCLKFKSQKEIEQIIESNLNNFEKMITNHLVDDNILKIIKKLNINFYLQKNQFIYEFYAFDLFYSEKTFNNANFKKCINFINKYGVIDEKYLAILYRNLNSLDVLNMLEKLLEKNPQYLNQQIYNYMLKIRTESSLFKKVLNIIKKFSNNFLTKETIDLLCEKCQTNKKEIYEPIIDLIRTFYGKNTDSEIILKNKDIFEIEMKEDKNIGYLTILKRFINTSNFIPERYFHKIFKIIKEDKNIYNFGLEIFLLAINKNLIIPNEIIDKLLEGTKDDLVIKLIQSLLTNKNYKKTYNKKLVKILEDNSKEINLKIINVLLSLTDFVNLENSIKEFILHNLNIYYDSLIEYKKISFWIFQDSLSNKKLFDEIKKSKFSDIFKDLEKCKKYEEKANFFLKDEIVYDDKIKELSENNNEKFELLKNSINNFEQKILKDQNDKKLKLLKIINFFISQKIKYNLTFNEILDCFNIYLTIDNYQQYYLKFENAKENYFTILRRNWIKIKIVNKNYKYSNETISSIIDNFYHYNFEDFLIEKIINLSLFSSIENINKLFDFLKDNQFYLQDIKNVINTLNKDDSFEILINESILSFSNRKISEFSIIPKFKDFYISLVKSLIKIKWKLFQIDELLTNEIKFDEKMKESEYKDILINIIEKNKISYNSVNNKNENLINILSKYESKYWEYFLKELGYLQNYGDLDEYSLDDLLLEIKEKNNDFSNELSEKLKNIIIKYRKLYNKNIEEDTSLPKYPIKNYEKKDIQKWSKSNRTKSLINNEDFLPEILAIINRAIELEENHNIRNVQLISVLLILLSPKNRGVFAQIKTGEGKSTIVSVIAVIKALQIKYVDILSSSIVLAQRDKNEKKMFYDYFNLTVGSNDDNEDEDIPLYQKNIVYGDTLMFEGDILKLEFSKDPNSTRAKNKERGFKCIIIDEVDSMCIDNLGSSTRLSNSFPSYEYLKILYPLIYNNLNLIDSHMDEGYYGEIKNEEERRKIVVKNLIDVTKHLLKENQENKDNKETRFLLPKNLKTFIEHQVPNWCNMAYQAKHYYNENFHYVIGKDLMDESTQDILKSQGYEPEEYHKIGTVDFSNTGVVSLNMTWSDGLHQFLQLKHGIKLKSEDLSTTFISHYSFFKRYFSQNENNIYGVTGTIGTSKSKFLLRDLFNVNIFIIPPFKPSKLIILKNKAEFKNKEEWQKEILNNIEINAKILCRAVLVICFTIKETNELYELLIKNGYSKDKIDKYQRNDDKTNKLKEFYDKGDIIIATNLAGRGTDVKLSEEVKKNGGLHVIVTFLPSNQRVEEQAIGRTARSGAKGSSIIIVNDTRNVEEIKLLRDFREEYRMEYIRTKTINKIKLKDELFNKFSLFYHDLQTKWVGKDLLTLNFLEYYFVKIQKSKEFSVLNDLEEKWGIWLKEMRIDEFDNNKTEKEINDKYKVFEDSLKKIYSDKKINDIILSNPLNYFGDERFPLATERDSELCLFSNYLNDMSSIIKGTKEISKTISNNLDNTISSLKDSLSPQIQSIIVLANGIKNNNLFVGTKMNELSEDSENKLKVIENLINKLNENKSVIEQYLENKKKYKLIPKMCDLKQLTKKRSVENYFKDIGIPYFYEITLKKEKNWFGMISIIAIGACEIALGVVLMHYMHNDFGFLKEGLNDIQYGVKCLLGQEEFDWKELGKRKLSFAINLAINVSLFFIRNNLKINFPKKRSIETTFKAIKDKAQSRLMEIGVDSGIKLSIKIFGKDFIVKVVGSFREFSQKLTIKFFREKIQEEINKNYGKTFEQMLTIEIVSGKNDWTKILTQLLKQGCKALSKLTSKIISNLINLIDTLIKKKGDWKEFLGKMFNDCVGEGFDIFKGSLNECLEIITVGFLNIFKKFAEKKLPDGVKEGLLTFNDLLDKALDIGDALKTQNLMEILVGNNIINKAGTISGKLLFGESYVQKKFNPIPIIIDEFKTSVIEKALAANNLVDYINKEIDNIANGIEDFIKKKVDEEMDILDNLMDQKLNDINIFIDDKFNKYVLGTVDKLEDKIIKGLNKAEDITDKISEEIKNKSKEFDDYSSKLQENIKEKIAKVEEKITEVKNKVNEKIQLFENIMDNQIDEKINKIKGQITSFEENVYTKINEFREKLKNEYQQMIIDLIQNLASGTGLSEKTENLKKKIEEISEKLVEKMDELKKLMDKLKSSIDTKIEEFISIWKKIKNSSQLEKVRNTIQKIKSILEEGIIPKLIDLMNIGKNKLNEAIDFIKNIISKIDEKLNKIKDKLKDTKNSIPEQKELIKKELNELKEELKKKIEEIKNYLMNQINSLKDKIIEKIADFIKEIKSNFNGYVDLLKELIDNVEKTIKEELDNIEEKLKLNSLDDLLNEIGEKANNIFNTNISDKFKEKIKNADKLLSNKIHNALDDIDFKEFKDKKAKIIDTLKDYQKKIDDFDVDAAKNETFKILENGLVNALIDVIVEAISSTEIGSFLKGKVEKYREIIDEASKYVEKKIDEDDKKKD